MKIIFTQGVWPFPTIKNVSTKVFTILFYYILTYPLVSESIHLQYTKRNTTKVNCNCLIFDSLSLIMSVGYTNIF